MMKMKSFLLCFPLIFFITGCWNMRELEHMFYIHSVGVDFVNNKYVVYAQILNFSTLAKKEGGGGKNEPGAWVGQGIGSTVDSAIQNLYSSSQRRIYWGHLNSVLLSKSVLEHGIDDVIDLVTRYNEIRFNVWVFATGSPLKKLLLTSPLLEESPVYSQLSDPYDVYEQSSYIPSIRLNKFVSMLREPGQSPLIPTIHIKKGQWADSSKNYPSIEIDGVEVLKKDQRAQWFPKKKLQGLRWLNKYTSRTPCIVYSPKNKPVAVLMMENPKPKIVPEIRNGKVFFLKRLK
ncbi:Ger(x)C family spore germination protein [Aneurinibacillus terranovensis]|uniref:Ger(x)C family spore germination protein n=1 Tax=Aneurinibacillus terranovensis TaxID=278991 RepID=UPI0003F67CB0|nr:Ger(x)C family spore germination protein [Aneurinibacillus terranovensis]